MDPIKLLSTGKNSDASVPNDFQDLCHSTLGQVLEIQKSSIDTVIRFNSCILDCFTFLSELTSLQQAAAQALFCFTELQMNCLAVFSPQALTKALTYVAAPSAEALERSMDIALGLCFTPSSWMSISGDRTSAAEAAPEWEESVAISVQAA